MGHGQTEPYYYCDYYTSFRRKLLLILVSILHMLLWPWHISVQETADHFRPCISRNCTCYIKYCKWGNTLGKWYYTGNVCFSGKWHFMVQDMTVAYWSQSIPLSGNPFGLTLCRKSLKIVANSACIEIGWEIIFYFRNQKSNLDFT